MRQSGCVFLLILLNLSAFAQDSRVEPFRQFVQAIEDNSFLIEEAYNQESGVVQHISTLMHFSKPSSDLLYTFTQEWPLFGQTHQLSATIPYMSLNESSVSGFGDVFLNYRYQLFDGNDWAAVAPRFSVILPVGDSNKGLGSDVLGFQLNLPLSKRLSDYFVVHANAGMTLLPRQHRFDVNGMQYSRTLTSYNFGASIIYLATSNLNFMLEWVYNLAGEFDGSGNLVYSGENILNPGLRAAINLGELQIVSGFAVPVSFSGWVQRVGVFFYLSFEHPF